MYNDGKFYLTIKVVKTEDSEILASVFDGNEYSNQDRQALKRIEHTVEYRLTLEEIGIVQDALRKINQRRKDAVERAEKRNKR